MQKGSAGKALLANIHGLLFEAKTSLESAFTEKRFKVDNGKAVYYPDETKIGYSRPQGESYKFLKTRNIDARTKISRKIRPNECFINELNKTVYIVEKKFQTVSGSVNDKISGCEF